MFQTKFVEKIKIQILYSKIFFYENRAVYEITWKNIVERGRPQMTTRHMCIALWMTKAKYVHTECVIFIVFPGINCCTNTPQCYVTLTRTRPVLFIITLPFT